MSQFDATSSALVVTVSGTVATGNVALPLVTLPFNAEVLGVSLSVGTAPTGAALVAQVLVGGTAAYSTAARPQVAAGATVGSAGVPDAVYKVPAGTTVQLNVAQVGSTVAGANLTATIAYRKA